MVLDEREIGAAAKPGEIQTLDGGRGRQLKRGSRTRGGARKGAARRMTTKRKVMRRHRQPPSAARADRDAKLVESEKLQELQRDSGEEQLRGDRAS